MNTKQTKAVVNVLKKARNILADNGLCRGYPAQTDSFRTVPPNSPKACRFCTLGAIARAMRSRSVNWHNSSELQRSAIKALADVVPDRYHYGHESPDVAVYRFNDDSANNRPEILEAFDRVIAKLEAEVGA